MSLSTLSCRLLNTSATIKRHHLRIEVEAQRNRRLVAVRQGIAAARRRAALARWNEAYERLIAVRPRSDEERLARHEALELMERARP